MKRVAIFNDTSTDRAHYGCRAVMDNLHVHLGRAGLDPVFAHPFDRDWRKSGTTLPEPGDIDAILINGEGSMHSSATRWRARSLSELGRLAKEHYGVPAVVLNATFHNNDAEFYRALRDFDLVFVRDTDSLNQAAAFGVAAEVVADLTLSMPYDPPGVARSGIGVTDSVRAEDDAILRAFARAGEYRFLPMVAPEKVSLSRGRFLKPKHLRRKLRSIIEGRDPRLETVAEFTDWLAARSLVVTGRYHTVTMCLLTRTPFFCLESNTPKIRSLLHDWGIDSRRIHEPRSLAGASLDPAEFAYSEREAANISANLQTTRTRTVEMFERIAQAVA